MGANARPQVSSSILSSSAIYVVADKILTTLSYVTSDAGLQQSAG